MDIVRNKSRKRKMPIKTISIICLVALTGWAITFASSSTHKVAASSVLLDEVKKGDFAIDVRGIGVLVPKEVYWVATETNGRVDKLFIKAGASVKKGDPIIT